MLIFSPQQDYFDHWFFLQRMDIKIINTTTQIKYKVISHHQRTQKSHLCFVRCSTKTRKIVCCTTTFQCKDMANTEKISIKNQ